VVYVKADCSLVEARCGLVKADSSLVEASCGLVMADSSLVEASCGLFTCGHGDLGLFTAESYKSYSVKFASVQSTLCYGHHLCIYTWHYPHSTSR